MKKMISEPKQDLEALLTEKGAAVLLNVSTRSLQSWRQRGSGPRFISISARCVRYLKSDIENWLTDKLKKSTSDIGGLV